MLGRHWDMRLSFEKQLTCMFSWVRVYDCSLWGKLCVTHTPLWHMQSARVFVFLMIGAQNKKVHACNQASSTYWHSYALSIRRSFLFWHWWRWNKTATVQTEWKSIWLTPLYEKFSSGGRYIFPSHYKKVHLSNKIDFQNIERNANAKYCTRFSHG